MSKRKSSNPQSAAQPAPDYNDTLFPGFAKKIAEFGGVDQDLADVFKVPLAKISQWKREHPEFAEAREAGKAAFDDGCEMA